MMEKIITDRKTLKKFSAMMGLAFLAITGLIFLKQKVVFLPAAVISGLFFVSGLLFCGVLKPVYIIWMKFAHLLGWINTRLILIIVFYLVFTPLGLMLKLIRKGLLDRKIEKKSPSYWWIEERKEFDQLDYERQF